MELTNELRNKVDLVLDNFDFDKVARVMEFLDWKYYGEADTPHKAELIQLARRLLFDSIKRLTTNSQREMGTGGFKTFVKHHEEDGYIEINLDFCLDSISSCDLEEC